jgi:two-component system response regulator NreC
MPIRLLIADDHGVLRAGLRVLLSAAQNVLVIGEAEDGARVLELARQTRPDLVLLDMSMPGPDSITVTRQLKEFSPETRVLILTLHEDAMLAREAIHAGASGYIIKRAAESELLSAIEIVMRGELYVHPALARALFSEEPPTAARADTGEALSQRELDVIRLIAQGHTNRQIADQLFLSVRTVEGYRANLMDKLGLHSRVELVRYARDKGLID